MRRCWRLWLGSRNLTGGIAWDAGLSIESGVDAGSVLIPSVAETAALLADRAEIDGFSAQRLRLRCDR